MRFIALASYIFRKEAKRELQDILVDADTNYIGENKLIVDVPLPRGEVLKKLKEREPIFIRNIFPVDIYYDKFEGFEKIASDIIRSGLLSRDLPFSIETIANKTDVKTRDLEVKVGTILEEKGYKVDRKNFLQTIPILIKNNKYYLGVARVEALPYRFFNLSKRYAKFPNRLNRAEFKLREALERRNLVLKGAYAIDLGAAPGGWSKVLAENNLNVISIDKGSLDEALKNNPQITHIRETLSKEKYTKNKRKS